MFLNAGEGACIPLKLNDSIVSEMRIGRDEDLVITHDCLCQWTFTEESGYIYVEGRCRTSATLALP